MRESAEQASGVASNFKRGECYLFKFVGNLNEVTDLKFVGGSSKAVDMEFAGDSRKAVDLEFAGDSKKAVDLEFVNDSEKAVDLEIAGDSKKAANTKFTGNSKKAAGLKFVGSKTDKIAIASTSESIRIFSVCEDSLICEQIIYGHGGGRFFELVMSLGTVMSLDCTRDGKYLVSASKVWLICFYVSFLG